MIFDVIDKDTYLEALIIFFCDIWWLLKEPLFSTAKCSLLGFLLSLLGQENSLDVGQHTSLGDGNTSQQLVQLLVIPDGQLKVTGDDSALLVVSGSVASQLQNLGGQILENSGQINGSSCANSLSVVTLAEKSVDTTHRELKSCSG